MSPLSVLVKVWRGGTPGQSGEICVGEAPMVPASIVFEGELTGIAERVPTCGVDDCAEGREN